MDNHAPHSLTLAQRTSAIRQPPVTQNHLFDGTKLPVVVALFQTTSNGMNLLFQLISTTQNPAVEQRMDSKKR
jgi:hypothetical protein